MNYTQFKISSAMKAQTPSQLLLGAVSAAVVATLPQSKTSTAVVTSLLAVGVLFARGAAASSTGAVRLHVRLFGVAPNTCVSALAEHASVVSFSRAVLELMAVGAPSRFVEGLHLAALDEFRHARAAFGLAQFFGGDGAAPSALPFPPSVAVSSSLASVALRVFQEGCVAETEAVARAQAELSASSNLERVQRHLAVIVADEARHAALAWRTVAWALRLGDAEVRASLQVELSRLQRDAARVSAPEERELVRQVLALVTVPWLDQLLSIGAVSGEDWPPLPFAQDQRNFSHIDAAVQKAAQLIADHVKTNGKSSADAT